MAGPLSDTPLPKDAERGGDHAHSHTTDTRGRTDKQVGGQTKTTQCGLLCAARRAERNVGLFPLTHGRPPALFTIAGSTTVDADARVLFVQRPIRAI